MSACASMLPTAGIAAGDDRLEAFGLDDARRQRVIGARHQHQLLAGHDGAEFLRRSSFPHSSSASRIHASRIEPTSRRHAVRGYPSPLCSHGWSRPCASPSATISSVCLSVRPMSSRPSSSRMRSAAGMSKVMSGPPGPLIVWLSQIDRERRRAVHRDHARDRRRRRRPAPARPAASRSAGSSRDRCRQSSCATMTRMLLASMPHTAASRDEPAPKLWPVTRMPGLRNCGLLSTKSGISLPSSRARA